MPASTAPPGEIARAIADELRERNLDVDCVEVEVASLGVFDAVILGSAVYAGRWRSEARHFLKKHRDTLSKVPFWIFSSGPVGEKAHEDFEKNSKWLEPHHVLELAESAGMRGHVVFGGQGTHGSRGIHRELDGAQHARGVPRFAGLGRDPAVGRRSGGAAAARDHLRTRLSRRRRAMGPGEPTAKAAD